MNNRKKIIAALAILVIFASLWASIDYLNKVYLPVKIKARLLSGLRENLQREVDIGRISFSLINGISIYDIRIYDNPGENGKILLSIDRASFHFLFIPLFKEQKVIVPLLRVYSPELNLRLDKDGSLNIPQFSPGKKPSPLLVYKIHVMKGNVFFTDERQAYVFSKGIKELDISLSAGNLKKLSFLLRGSLIPPEEKASKIYLRGSYTLASGEFNARLKASFISLAELQPYLKDLPLEILSGEARDLDINAGSKGKKLSFSGSSSLKGLKAKVNGLFFQGDADITPQISFDTAAKSLAYKVGIGINSASASGIPYINEASSIRGALEWSDKGISANLLQFRSLDSDFSLSGSLQDFSKPLLKAALESEALDLGKAFLLFNRLGDIALNGKSKLKIALQGEADELLKNIKAELTIEDASLKLPLLKGELEHIKGNLSAAEDALSWQDLSFSYSGTPYTSSGRLLGLENPQIDFTLKSKDLELDSDIKIDGGLATLRKVKAKYIGSSCDVKGSVGIEDPSRPLLDLAFFLDIDPEDIQLFLPKETAEMIRKLKLKGAVRVSGALSGNAGDPKGLYIQAKGESETFSVYNLKLARLSFGLAQKDGMLSVYDLTAYPYSGTLNSSFVCNLNAAQPSYSLKLNSLGLLLEEMSLDIGVKDKSISGIIDANINLVGDLSGPSSLKGNGSISVHQGKLWQVNLLKGLGELFLLSDYRNIVFREARADFHIGDNAVSTDDLELLSEQLKFDCEGSLGFDGKINFTAYAQVNKELIRESADLRKFTAAILGELSSAITIKIGGTVQKPTYRLIPMPLDVIKGIKDFILGR